MSSRKGVNANAYLYLVLLLGGYTHDRDVSFDTETNFFLLLILPSLAVRERDGRKQQLSLVPHLLHHVPLRRTNDIGTDVNQNIFCPWGV